MSTSPPTSCCALSLIYQNQRPWPWFPRNTLDECFFLWRTSSQCKLKRLKSEFTMKWDLFTLHLYILKVLFSSFFYIEPFSPWPLKFGVVCLCVRHLPFDTPNNDTTFQLFRDRPVILVVSRMLIWSKSQKLSSYFSLRAQRDQAM